MWGGGVWHGAWDVGLTLILTLTLTLTLTTTLIPTFTLIQLIETGVEARREVSVVQLNDEHEQR